MNDKLLIDRTLLEQALDALLHRRSGSDQVQRIDAAITDLCAALAKKPEPAQEPVGEMRLSEIIDGMVVPAVPAELPVGTKLYTAPQPQRPPLTDEEIEDIFKHLCSTVGASYKTMARAIERKVRGE